MSIAAIVTRGYGTFGSIADVVRFGYDASEVIEQPMRSFLAITQGAKTRAALADDALTTITIAQGARTSVSLTEVV